MPATTRTISLVQLYVRRDQMMANLRSIRSFDASVALLSPEDRARYFNTEQAEQLEQARVARKATSRTAALATLVVAAVAACDAAPVDGFTAPPAAGITSAASTDAPPAEPGTTGDADDADESTADAPDAGTTTAPVDAATTSGGDDSSDPGTTGDASTATATSTGDASTTTGDSTGGGSTTGGDTSTGGDDTTGGGGESSTGDEPPAELPPECLDYVPLTDANRNVSFGVWGPKSCDAMTAGWYRLMGAAGAVMPTTPPPIYSCGTQAPGWMSGGSHPTVADGVVERTTCWHWDQDADAPGYPDQPCWSSAPLKVRNCGDFFVYFLTVTPNCHSRFCGVDA